jgi:LacI family transcriptional regulator
VQARPPTMNDVAAAASVGLKTVSRFVNGATNIDPVLAARIGLAIEALDYRHNLAAASIRPGRSSKLIGLVIGDLANPYYSSLARSIERVCSAHGYLLMSMSCDEDTARHQLLIDRLIAQRVDGLIVVPPRDDPNSWADAARQRMPLVVVDRPVTALGIHTIVADNAGGAEAATTELVRQGAARVAFIGDSLGLYTMRERLAGYRRIIEHDYLGFSAGLTFTGAHTADQASDIVLSLLEKNRADAIFAANNR